MFPLQVWYAASYAEFVNQKIHDVTEEERKGESLQIILTLLYFDAVIYGM